MTIKTPPLDIHEGHIERHRIRNPGTREFVSDPVIERLTRATAAMRTNAEKISDIAVALQGNHSFKGETERNNFSFRANSLLQDADGKITEAMTFAFGEIDRVNKIIRPPILKEGYAAEIRTWFRNAKPEERATALASSDDAILAVVNGPAFLSGMTDAEIDLHRAKWTEKKFPDEADRLRRISKALSDAQRIAKSGDSYFRDVVKSVVTPSISSARLDAALAAVE